MIETVFLSMSSAAEMLDLSPSAWRAVYPVLAAHHGLKVIGLCGPKFAKSNVANVISRLAEQGLDIKLDMAGRRVHIGGNAYPITSSRSGKSGRGRPRKDKALAQ